MTPDSVTSPLTERFLEERGLDWELKVIPIADIDMDLSLRNQARIAPADPELAERYRQSDEAGAVFPAVIACKNGSPSSKYVLGDGIHRTLAKTKNKRPMIWAYCVQVDTTEQFYAISRTANAILNGRDNSEAERLMHAAAFVDQGVDRKTAAVQCGVSQGRLDSYIQAQRARSRFRDLGIGLRQYDHLGDSTLANLSSATTDGAARRVFEILAAKVPTQNVIKVLREARSANTESARANAQVEALNHLLETTTGGNARALVQGKKDTTRIRLLGAIKVVTEINQSGKRDQYDTELGQLRDLCDAN